MRVVGVDCHAVLRLFLDSLHHVYTVAVRKIDVIVETANELFFEAIVRRISTTIPLPRVLDPLALNSRLKEPLVPFLSL